jgi:hypothetical protein
LKAGWPRAGIIEGRVSISKPTCSMRVRRSLRPLRAAATCWLLPLGDHRQTTDIFPFAASDQSCMLKRFLHMAAKDPVHWQLPTAASAGPVLRVLNTLTHSKQEFIPRHGRNVTWYNCGPTVYDDSHMGHARNYVTQDLIRRILRDYFGYNVHFVMNITDIDDKVRLHARWSFSVKFLARRSF